MQKQSFYDCLEGIFSGQRERERQYRNQMWHFVQREVEYVIKEKTLYK